ncbi:hypothetical protein ACFQ7M_39645 [Streptomyces massasporeus]
MSTTVEQAGAVDSRITQQKSEPVVDDGVDGARDVPTSPTTVWPAWSSPVFEDGAHHAISEISGALVDTLDDDRGHGRSASTSRPMASKPRP